MADGENQGRTRNAVWPAGTGPLIIYREPACAGALFRLTCHVNGGYFTRFGNRDAAAGRRDREDINAHRAVGCSGFR